MEPSELEKNLTELEEKMERVRALYEQYFVGLEKIEPQIPRKDVDRIIAQLRKEQIRNTAMRFKFQTLVQRYNTMQQHWGRTMREIENGTFRRDVLKAAARFGAEEALTGVGRKQAEKLKKVIEAQRERLGTRQGKRSKRESIVEELSASDVELMDEFDEAPTPPPSQAGALPHEGLSPQAEGYDPAQAEAYAQQQAYYAQQQAYYAQQQEYARRYAEQQAYYAQQGQQMSPQMNPQMNPQMGWDPAYAQGQQGYGQPGGASPGNVSPGNVSPGNVSPGNVSPGNVSPGNVSPNNASSANAFSANASQVQANYDHTAQGRAGSTGAQARSAVGGFAADPLAFLEETEATASIPGGPEPVKKKGGLRWGGLGARRADPEALKRMASLAGAEGGPSSGEAVAPATAAAPPIVQPAEPPKPARKPLLSSPIDLGLPDPEPEEKPAPRAAPVSQRRPLLSGPLDLDLGAGEAESGGPSTARSASPPPNRPAAPPVATPDPPAPARPSAALRPPPAASGGAPASDRATPPPSDRPAARPQLRPPPSADGPSRGAAPKSAKGHEFGELNDSRLREIYGQYVQARRDRNESTAGITFEKLADSLRSQADKLKGKHASKRVDYEVVVKDGKTLIKPIVK